MAKCKYCGLTTRVGGTCVQSLSDAMLSKKLAYAFTAELRQKRDGIRL